MDTTRARQRLDEERAGLLEARAGLLEQHGDGAGEAASISELASYDQHDADMATETFEREKDQSLPEHIGTQLDEIDRATAKLDDGSYGACEACGQPIGNDRLEAFPAARFCVRDQSEAEDTGLPR